MGDDFYSKGLNYDTSPPAAVGNDEWRGARQTRYNERYAQPIGNWRFARAREQTYFIAHNPTIDQATTLIGHAAPLLADADVTMTKPLVAMVMPTSSTVKAELDYIEIDVVTAGATGVSAEWTAQLDNARTISTPGISFTRVNPNGSSTTSPGLLVTGGPIVIGAETTSCRVLGNGFIRQAIEFAGDRTTFIFGGEPGNGANVVAGAASRSTVALPPVILGSGDGFFLALYSATGQNAAGIYRVRMAWSER